MPMNIDRAEVQRLLSAGAQLLEVLPREEFAEAHIPGALNIPLDELTPETAARLDQDRPVITYCYDTQCDMSPRAAWRLESLGFERVFEYAPGKADWMGAGLPIDGTAADVPMIGALARADVPTCGLGDTVLELRRQLEDTDWDSCLVVNEQQIVLGRVYRSQLTESVDGTAEQLMDPGPSTYRPDVTAAEMAERMRAHDLATAPVTASDGRLLGLLFRDDVEMAATSHDEAAFTRENPAARSD